MTIPHIERLNRRLKESLGSVCGGMLPRFCWRWAPSEPWFVYDSDNRTLLKKSWAEWPGPDGKPIGRSWVMGQFRKSDAYDHCGFGEGTRVAAVREYGWAPHFEMTVMRGELPTEELNQNAIWAIERQMSVSREQREDSMSHWMAEEKYSMDTQQRRASNEHLERSRQIYDNNVGAFGNCEVGVGDGYFSWGGIGESPLLKRLAEATSASQ